MSKPTRWLAGVVVAAMALVAFSAGVVGAKPKPGGKKDSGVIFAAITRTANGLDYIAGTVSDKVLGAGAVTFPTKVISSPGGKITLTVKPVTSFYKDGSLSGTSAATLTLTATGLSISGNISETKGSGAKKGHSFVGTFTGVSLAKAPTSPLAGPFMFNYKGTYK
ncbi:MAG TPA: hypothetical protein VIX82_03530 [Solirubrobacteraceae bacterium]